jgi:hypothetical protein
MLASFGGESGAMLGFAIARPSGRIFRHMRRTLSVSLVVAASLAAASLVAASLAASGAQAQYGPFGPFERDYRDPYGWWAPPPSYRARPPIVVQRPIPPRVMASFLRDEGLVAIERLERLDDVYIAHGRDRQGRRLRLVADAYDGMILDRVRLSEPPRERARPLPPRERPATPPVARPAPERSAPATRAPQPTPQPPSRPAEARPATPVPPAAPSQPPAAAPSANAPAPAAAAPTVPGSGGVPAVRVPDVPPPIIPVQPLDDATSRPRPATPQVPAAPLL